MLAALALSLTVAPQSAPVAPAESKPLAVMIHGAGGGGWEYDFWKPVFEAKGFEVVAPDMMPVAAGLAATGFDDYLKQTVAAAKGRSDVVLIGASMGGILVLKAAETVKPKAIVLVNPVGPKHLRTLRTEAYPEIIRWKDGPLQDTIDSLPDGDRKTIEWAHPQWRDESGKVLNEIGVTGIDVKAPVCPVLMVIGNLDTDITPDESLKVASWAKADVFSYAGMSHIGPLMGLRREEVASDIADWTLARLKSSAAQSESSRDWAAG